MPHSLFYYLLWTLGHGQIESLSYEMFPLNFRLTIGVQLEVSSVPAADGDGLSER